MDGENNGTPIFEMDDFGVPLFSETSIYGGTIIFWKHPKTQGNVLGEK